MTIYRDMSFRGITPADLVEVYRHLFRTHGAASPRALGWQDEGRHQTHHRILTREIRPGSRVVDFGCGMGDLFGFFRKVRLPVQYEGFDQVPELLAAARQKYPGGYFEVRSSLEGLKEKSRHYVVACGVFAYRLIGHIDFVKRALAEFARVAKEGFSADFPAAEHLPGLAEDYFAVDRERLEELLRGSSFQVETSPRLKSHFVFVDLNGRVL
ncbi:class I SAM-dependent methyltransferase [Candidatus Saganbacteria bacterium]|nr:class I SAM-dependent methyltransferase [Candidatus Saganbacteria bacterium]